MKPIEIRPSDAWKARWDARATVARSPADPGLFLALAPMDGVTDGSYRAIATSIFGGRSGISLCVSEFVRVTRQPVPPAVFRRHCPELDTGGRTRSGVPVLVQLLGGDPHWMAEAARVAAGLGAPGIDLNFGCPAKTVNNSDGGATLLKQPQRIERVTSAVREAVPDGVLVSVKVRIGWDDASAMAAIARAAQRGGASWLTVHGRTRRQLYKPPVDWRAIGRAREAAPGLPVIANGDLVDVDSLHRCAASSGCSSFMIGRGAMGRPELFARARGWFAGELDSEFMIGLVRRYVDRLLLDGASERAALGRLKQWLRMGAPARADLAAWFERGKREQSLAGIFERLRLGQAQGSSM